MLPYWYNYVWLLNVVIVFAAPYGETSEDVLVSRAAPVPQACKQFLDAQDAEDQAFRDQSQKKAVFPLWLQSVKKAGPDDKFVSANVVVPQQADMELVLKATYFYTCGLTGSHSRRFTWMAQFRDNQGMSLVALQNIDGFFNVEVNVPEPGGFRAVFHAHWDFAYAEMCCRYTATGHIEGALFHDKIGMDLITMSGPVDRRPYLSESCRVGRRTPAPVPPPCTITYVHVEQG